MPIRVQRQNPRILFLSAAAAAPGLALPAMAQEVPDEVPPERIALPDESPDGGDLWSVTIGTGLVTEYISRGIMFAEEVSLQPYITVTRDLPEMEGGAITDASVFVGSWGNVKLGSIPPGPAGRLTRFYETDLYAGGSVELAERWNISAAYYRYESLGDSFEGYNDLELIVGFDDSAAWDDMPLKNFSLSPSLRLVQEAGRPGRKDALYIQPSLTPSFDAEIAGAPVSIAIPLMIGLSDEYYDAVDGGLETFGFFRTGVTVSGQPAPNSAPSLTISGGLDLWVPNHDVASGLDQYDAVGKIGISWSL